MSQTSNTRVLSIVYNSCVDWGTAEMQALPVSYNQREGSHVIETPFFPMLMSHGQHITNIKENALRVGVVESVAEHQ